MHAWLFAIPLAAISLFQGCEADIQARASRTCVTGHVIKPRPERERPGIASSVRSTGEQDVF
jgi:hypothetical protein